MRKDGASAVLFARYCGRHEIAVLIRRRVTALDVFEACALGDTERLAALLDADRALVNAVAEDRFGPLASFFDHEPAVRLLLSRGAHADQASANGMRVELSELLLGFGADPTVHDGEGHSAADHARSRGHEEAARRLGWR